MRPSEERVLSTSDFDAITEDGLESGKNLLVTDIRVEEEVFAILVAELYPDEVLVMIWEFAENAVVRFHLWTMQCNPGGCDGDFMDMCEVLS